MARKHSTGATITVLHPAHTQAAALETLRTSQDRQEQYRAFVVGALTLSDAERDQLFRILAGRSARRAPR